MKSPFKSVTLWLNFIPTVLSVLTLLQSDALIQSNPKMVLVLSNIVFLLNIANRFRTVVPVSFTKE